MCAAVCPVRVALVDDFSMVRDGLRHIFDASGEAAVTMEACTGAQALDALQHQSVDVAVVDLSLPGMSGLDLIKRLRNEHPTIGIVALSLHAEAPYAWRAFAAGARGYVTKDRAFADMPTAVRQVAAGGTFLSASLLRVPGDALERGIGPP